MKHTDMLRVNVLKLSIRDKDTEAFWRKEFLFQVTPVLILQCSLFISLFLIKREYVGPLDIYLANRFQVAERLFSNRLQMTSKLR